MKTIIVATDFSKEAENALNYACAFASKIEAQVVLFNSYNMPIHAANTLLPPESITYVDDNNRRLLAERAKKYASKYSIEVEYETGLLLQVSDALNELFEKYEADLIVMGMAPKTLAQDIFGNTTTSAIMKLSYPVLAIPEGADYAKGINTILLATDVSREVQKESLRKVKELASILNAEVEIFSVQDNVKKLGEVAQNSKIISEIDEGLEGVRHYYRDVESNAVIEEIEKEVRRINADLLVMLPHKYGFWESLVHRSKTRLMASGSDIPLLSIPAQE